MDEYRLLQKKINKNNKKNDKGFKNYVVGFINRILVCALIFIIALVLIKDNNDYKTLIYENVYENDLTFSKIGKIYTTYVDKFFKKIESNDNLLAVSNEKIDYDNLEEIENGVKLKVKSENVIPTFEEGIVLYVGNKDDLENVLVIKQIDGVEVWFIGIDTDLNIYDYVEKKEIIGKCISDELKIYFKHNGEIVDYKDYIF